MRFWSFKLFDSYQAVGWLVLLGVVGFHGGLALASLWVGKYRIGLVFALAFVLICWAVEKFALDERRARTKKEDTC